MDQSGEVGLSARLKSVMILRGRCVRFPPGSRRMEPVNCRELAAMWKLLLIFAAEEMKTRPKVLFSKILLEKFKGRQKLPRLLGAPSLLVIVSVVTAEFE